MADECKPVEWILLPFEASRISFYKSKYLSSRKMKEMNLRDAEVNLYDAEYSAGLRQVADISNASILKQIMLDENDSADMIIQQRELINKYKKIADEYEEKSRILLRENIDLKALIKENGIDIEEV